MTGKTFGEICALRLHSSEGSTGRKVLNVQYYSPEDQLRWNMVSV